MLYIYVLDFRVRLVCKASSYMRVLDVVYVEKGCGFLALNFSIHLPFGTKVNVRTYA